VRDTPSKDIQGRVTVSIAQACFVVGVSRRTIYNWLQKGKLEWVRTAGGSIRIVQDSLFRSATEG
jgi:excisionase family DNA binding protein